MATTACGAGLMRNYFDERREGPPLPPPHRCAFCAPCRPRTPPSLSLCLSLSLSDSFARRRPGNHKYRQVVRHGPGRDEARLASSSVVDEGKKKKSAKKSTSHFSQYESLFSSRLNPSSKNCFPFSNARILSLDEEKRRGEFIFSQQHAMNGFPPSRMHERQ
jgi:hypothetical protein